jgi:pimeloyl-ACP methyl ester carboxylesterase
MRSPLGRGQVVRVDDIEMYCEEFGAGEALVLLHGFGGSARNWHPFTEELSRRHRLIAVDLRGHGHSTNPQDSFTHRQAAIDVFHLLDKLGIDRFSAIGISSGGMTLLHMATSQPARVEAMVLVSATSHFPDQARAIMRETSFDRMPRDVQQMYRECATRGDAQVHQLIAQFKALHDNLDDMNFSAADLSAIQARTLVVHGDRDRFFPIEIAIDLSCSIPRAELWTMADVDHVPLHDLPVPFASTVLRFVEARDGR